MTSKKSKDHSKMKYVLGKKSKGEKSEMSMEKSLSSESSVENFTPSDGIDLLATNASPEQYYIQTLKQEINRLRKKLDDSLDNNGEILRAKASHIEDKINLQKALADSETEIQALKSQHLVTIQSLKHEVNSKSDTLRALDEAVNFDKGKYQTLEQKYVMIEKELSEKRELIESRTASAMNYESEVKALKASLSELSDRMKGDEAKVAESNRIIVELKSMKKCQQESIIQLERQLAEYQDREGFLANDGARMANTISQHHENYEQMNQLIAQMKVNMNSLKEQRDAENARANMTEHQFMEMMKTSNELQQKKTEFEERVINIEKQNKMLIAELKKSQQILTEVKEAKASLSSKLEQVEKDKVALVLEQINHVKEIDSLHELVDAADDNITAMKVKIEEEIKLKHDILASRAYQDNDILKLQDDKVELQEHIDLLKKELVESDRIKCEVHDMYRHQQQENVARIAEYAEKTSSQSDELMKLKEEISSLNALKASDLMIWDHERSELSSQVIILKQRVSSLADEVEEYHVKLESSRAEVDELRDHIKQASLKQEQQLEFINNQHHRDMDQIKTEMKAEHDREIEQLKSSYQSIAEEKYRNVMSASKEANDKRMVQYNSKVNDLTTELNSIKASLQASELAYKNEADKLCQTIQQLKELRKFSEENAMKLQDKVRVLEKDKAMMISKYTAEVEDLNEQLHSMTEAMKRKDHNIELFRQQINSEKEMRYTLSQRLLELEDYQSKSKMQERSELQRIQQLQEQVGLFEAKYETLRKEKDVEIDRLQKRNDMLSETVTRLTNITKESLPIPTLPSPRPNSKHPNHHILTVEGNTIPPTPSSSSSVANSTFEGKRKVIRPNLTIPSNPINASSSSVDKVATPSSQSATPNHRALLSQQVNTAINKVQDAIDRRKMKALENEVSITPTSSSTKLDPNAQGNDSPLKMSASLRLLKADIESTPKSRSDAGNNDSPVVSPSRRDLDKSFSERFRETVRSSKEFTVLPYEGDNDVQTVDIDIHEEY